MKDFASVPRTSGAFPNVITIADTSPGSKNGTPMVKIMFDEFLGVFQAALRGASYSPSGSADAAGAAGSIENSQFLKAISAMFQPAGTLVGIFTDTVPTGARYIKLEGQTILRATYPRLITNVERAYTPAGCFHRCDAGGTPNPAGDYILLPDMRGVFPRGRDVPGGVDPDGATRYFGGMQTDALQRHNHIIDNLDSSQYPFEDSTSFTTGTASGLKGTGGVGDVNIEASATHIGEDIGVGFTKITPAGRVDSETRPYNTVVTWCITF